MRHGHFKRLAAAASIVASLAASSAAYAETKLVVGYQQIVGPFVAAIADGRFDAAAKEAGYSIDWRQFSSAGDISTYKLAAPLGAKGPEGIFNLGDLDPKEAFKPSGIEEVLVINTLPWERTVIVEEPEPRGGAAPVGILDCFFNRGSGWGGGRPIPPVRRLGGIVPAMGYAFLKIAPPDSSRSPSSPRSAARRARASIR